MSRSKAGKVGFTLTEGPRGLKGDPDGKGTFAAPKELEKGEVTAVIAASDASKQERFHKPTIRVD